MIVIEELLVVDDGGEEDEGMVLFELSLNQMWSVCDSSGVFENWWI